MADGEIRIKDFTTASSIRSDDYIAVDGATNGTKKYPLKPTLDELSNIRVGADGKTYESAGDAVRGQVNKLNNKRNINNKILSDNVFNNDLFANATIVNERIYNYNTHAYATGWTDYSTAQVTIEAGAKYAILGYKTALHSYSGYNINNANGQRVTDGQVTDDFILVAPANSATLVITFITADSANMHIIKLNDITTNIDSLKNKNLEISNTLGGYAFGENIMKTGIITNDRFYDMQSHAYQNWPTYSTVEFSVKAGDIYRIYGFRTIHARQGYIINNAAGGKVLDANITGDFIITIPTNGAKLTVTFYTDDEDYITIARLNNNADVLAYYKNTNEFVNNLISKRITLKGFDDTIDGFDYFAFSSGITYKGKQVYALRGAYGHTPYSAAANWGKIYIYYSENNEVLNHIVLDVDYQSLAGELRDINLSKTRNGEYLLLSAFSYTYPTLSDPTTYLFVLNEDYEVLNTIVISDNLYGWGNILETEDGYLLKLGYNAISDSESTVSLYKSDTPTTSGFNNMTFSKIYEFTNPDEINEATLTYANGKLVAFMRSNVYNGVIYETNDLTGASGWSEPYITTMKFHSPAVLPFYKGSLIPVFIGYLYSQTVRIPAIMWYELTTHEIKKVSFIDETLTGWGGYPAFIKLGDDDYRVMYYDDYLNTKTALYYKKFNPYLDGDIDYIL